MDVFYTDKGGFDLARIPLIKPYEAVVSATGDKDWIIRSINDSTLFTIPGVKEITVLNNQFIFIHGFNTIVNYTDVKEAWFVLIPKTNYIKPFLNKNDYLKWIINHGINKEPILEKPTKVYHYFDRHGSIDWSKMQKE